ncbi:MAG: SUF system NifU family Fe-S cluster assembly protein [Magnetococcales bacterium]|nr:SUF system NifU family Fe-S cluster assembly protein [Magnetococcales bacterium]
MTIDREFYEEVILDHNRHPYHYMEIPPGANHRGYGFNPVCGDEFTLHLEVASGVIRRAGFEGVGCALSVASASLMTEAAEGLSLDEAEGLIEQMGELFHGTGEGEAALPPGIPLKLEILSGVRESPMRIKCANLAWHILHAALHSDPSTVCTE